MPPANSTTLKRIHREIADLKKEDLGAIKLGPAGDNMFRWSATLPGPQGSVYEGGVFNVDIVLAPDYPFSAPHMTFRTRIYHMNISERGGICIDILKHNWSPALSLFKVILSLSSLLTDPNPKDPLVPSIATEYVRNRKKHDSTAREWTRLYAKPPPPPSPPVIKSIPAPKATTPAPSARARGKARAATTAPPSQNGHSSSTASASSVSARSRNPTTISEGVIEIPDSDDEGRGHQSRSDAARSRRQTSATVTSTGKRKRGSGGDGEVDVVVLDDDVPPRASTRRRTEGPSSGSGSGRTNGDVIVIED